MQSTVRQTLDNRVSSKGVPHQRLKPESRPRPLHVSGVCCRLEARRLGMLTANYATTPVDYPKQGVERVEEVMTAGEVYTVRPHTPVIEAIELVVDKRITGLPVVDHDRKVVGVVSDFDLLAIDLATNGHHSMFPSLDQSWEAFHQLQNLISKSEGKVVEDVMTDDPIVVRGETSIHAAARLLLETKTRRLPVVDAEGRCIGILTRRDVVIAALAARRRRDDNLF